MLSEREKDCVNSDNNYIEEEKKDGKMEKGSVEAQFSL